MKNQSCFLSILVIASLFVLTGCETLQFGNQNITDAEISPLKTFAVAPVFGSVNQVMATDATKLRQLTREAIVTNLEDKGYTLAMDDAAPDFTVYAQWMITMQNNRESLMNSGDVETSMQIPELSRMATVAISIQTGKTGAYVWRNDSPWPFNAGTGNEADVSNSVRWALDTFPVHQANAASGN